MSADELYFTELQIFFNLNYISSNCLYGKEIEKL